MTLPTPLSAHNSVIIAVFLNQTKVANPFLAITLFGSLGFLTGAVGTGFATAFELRFRPFKRSAPL